MLNITYHFLKVYILNDLVKIYNILYNHLKMKIHNPLNIFARVQMRILENALKIKDS